MIEADKTFCTVRQLASDVLQIPPEQVTLTCSPENLSSWDSVQHLILVLALEAEFGVQFNPEEMNRMNSIGQILDLVQTKRAAQIQGD